MSVGSCGQSSRLSVASSEGSRLCKNNDEDVGAGFMPAKTIEERNLKVAATSVSGLLTQSRSYGDFYDVVIVSPRNHFLFTPLLPSTTVGTIEFRSIIEPIR